MLADDDLLVDCDLGAVTLAVLEAVNENIFEALIEKLVVFEDD